MTNDGKDTYDADHTDDTNNNDANSTTLWQRNDNVTFSTYFYFHNIFSQFDHY